MFVLEPELAKDKILADFPKSYFLKLALFLFPFCNLLIELCEALTN